VSPAPTIRHSDGYVLVYLPEHPTAPKTGYVYEHRVVVEAALGRYLRTDEIVHHLNEDRTDNRPENLEVVTKAWHQQHHMGRSGLSDSDVAALVRSGATYRALVKRGVWQHRTRRIRRLMAEGSL
jgi:hypothetical protein